MSLSDISLDKLEDFKRVGIAFSGGLDSSVLLSFIKENFIHKDKLYVLHINHGVHEDSDRWEAFCRDQAHKFNIKFKSWKLDKLPKSSEEILRNYRYSAFQEWAEKDDLIITAHHLDDQIETLLFRILRGTGINGLSGINKNSNYKELNIFRPFLDTKKDEIFSYAEKLKLEWIEDSSNNENQYSRNIIRNSIIPKLLERWPNLDKSLTHLSERAQKAQKIILEIAEEDHERMVKLNHYIDKAILTRLSDERQENLIHYWLSNVNNLRISSKQLNEINLAIKNPPQSSSSFDLYTKNGFLKFKIFITQKELNLVDVSSINNLPSGFEMTWNFQDLIKIPTGTLSTKEQKGKGLAKKYFCSEAVIRTREGGERCRPYGRDKSQKIKNLFQEYKIPDWKRDQIPLIYINEKIAAVGDLWVCDEFHADLDETGFSIVWDNVV